MKENIKVNMKGKMKKGKKCIKKGKKQHMNKWVLRSIYNFSNRIYLEKLVLRSAFKCLCVSLRLQEL